MNLEDEIKQQKGFKGEYHKAFVNIIYTAAWLNGLVLRALKPFGISPEQYNVLRILRGQYPKPASITVIQDRMLDKNSNASRLVEKLRQKHLVSRQACPDDRRQVDVLITAKGLELLTEADTEVENQHEVLKTISQDEALQLNTILDRLRG